MCSSRNSIKKRNKDTVVSGYDFVSNDVCRDEIVLDSTNIFPLLQFLLRSLL